MQKVKVIDLFKQGLKIEWVNINCVLCDSRGWQKDFRKDLKKGENVPCWFIHKNGKGLIDGEIGDYIVSGLFKTI